MTLTLPGPAGVLEARLDQPPAPVARAVLCHPHPQYGGNMFDAVLDVLAGRLLAHSVAVLRFNFRGVGASSGHFDQGRGEAADLRAAITWLEDQSIGDTADALWLGGYSFGAAIVWQALAETRPARVLLVAPPVRMLNFAQRAPTCPVDVFAGDADAFIDAAALSRWQGIRAHVLAGADHFFMGRHDELAVRIADALAVP